MAATADPRGGGESFGTVIRRLRMAAGLTQEELADRAGLSVRGLRYLESDRTSQPRRSSVQRLIEQLSPDEPTTVRLQRLTRPGQPGRAPAQLPAPHAGFTGRDQEQSAVLRALATARDGGAEPPVVLIHGQPGIGKTALALRVAHLAAAQFPGGVLYADLRGATASPAEPHRVLAGWCQALGAAPDAIPADSQARASYFRSLLARQRILVVCDDARDAAQVLPLLPGTGGSAALITSRLAFAAPAIAADVPLGLLDEAAAAELVRSAVAGQPSGSGGPAGTGDREELIGRITAACGRLPLALRIATGRLAHYPAWTLAAYAGLLEESRDQLIRLRLGDSSVRASFDESYQALAGQSGGGAARDLFDRLAVHDGPFLTSDALAAISGQRAGLVEDTMDLLCRVHLAESPVPHRYTMHDLLRAYGRGHLTATGRREVLTALIGHLACPPAAPADLAWFTQQRDNLVVTAGAAAASDQPPAGPLPGLLDATGDIDPRAQDESGWRAVAEATARAAQAAGHDQALATALSELCVIERLALRLDAAERHGKRSLGLFQAAAAGGTDLSRAWNRLGTVHTLQKRHDDAARCYTASLRLRQRGGDHIGQGSVLNNLGLTRRAQGRLGDAERCFAAARAAYESAGDLQGQAIATLNSGAVHHEAGSHRLAIGTHAQAVRLARRAGSPSSVHYALCGLADSVRETGRPGTAITIYRRLLSQLDGTGDRDLYRYVTDGLAAAEQMIRTSATAG
jgi:tetratricopeptide (TPR) repeat protein